MTYQPHGKHLIAGEWIASPDQFTSQPVTGEGMSVSAGGATEVDQAVQAAEAAFETYGWSSRETRASLLEAIAEEIEARGADITRLGMAETGLPEARLEGERGRTTGQLRLFASHIRAAWLSGPSPRFRSARPPADAAPGYENGPAPDWPGCGLWRLKLSARVLNRGGDTASALAAGCPVVVKGHPAHPATGEIVAEAIRVAIQRCGMPAGVFSLVQGVSHDLGHALVTHPLIRAVGFTGSLGAGRALFDLCAGRPDPIPFFGELGSINPVFVMPNALEARAEALGQGWAASLTMGVGQFCTNPGIVIAPKGAALERFVAAARAALADAGESVMLTEGIANAYRSGAAEIAQGKGVQEVLTSTCDRRNAAPLVYRVSAADWLSNEALSEEVFGPLGLIVEAADTVEMLTLARGLKGQLTATLQMDPEDTETARPFVPVLERKAGRVLVNGFPTGVEVADAMVHGGPYPASTNFGATSVGTLAIRRFVRPVCYQNLPDALLPEDLL